jgi:hypothetical protein
MRFTTTEVFLDQFEDGDIINISLAAGHDA